MTIVEALEEERPDGLEKETSERFKLDYLHAFELERPISEQFLDTVLYDGQRITAIVITFILMTIASCPFHGWQSFQAFLLGSGTEDDLPQTLERVYTWGSSLEMVIGLLSGAALDIFGAARTSSIGLAMYHFSCLTLCPLIAIRNGSWGEGLRTFFLRHQTIAMTPWKMALAILFASPNFTSMGWFVFRDDIEANRLSSLVAGTQYLSSFMSAFWWWMGEYTEGYNGTVLLLSASASLALVLGWIPWAMKSEQRKIAPVTTSSTVSIDQFYNPPFLTECIATSTRPRGTSPSSTPSTSHSNFITDMMGRLALPPYKQHSPSKLYAFHLTAGFSILIRSHWFLHFAYWYGTSIFLMTYYDARFRSMLLRTCYQGKSDLPRSLIMTSSLSTLIQAPLCFGLGEWIHKVPYKHKTFVVSILCLCCSSLYAFALIFLTQFPYFSVICNGIAGSFVYGSKYWFTDACISGGMMTSEGGKDQYGIITGTMQLIAGLAALLNLITTHDGVPSNLYHVTSSQFHSVASAVAVSGLIPGIILITMLWRRRDDKLDEAPHSHRSVRGKPLGKIAPLLEQVT